VHDTEVGLKGEWAGCHEERWPKRPHRKVTASIMITARPVAASVMITARPVAASGVSTALMSTERGRPGPRTGRTRWRRTHTTGAAPSLTTHGRWGRDRDCLRAWWSSGRCRPRMPRPAAACTIYRNTLTGADAFSLAATRQGMPHRAAIKGRCGSRRGLSPCRRSRPGHAW
jgi:hypothetical protein